MSGLESSGGMGMSMDSSVREFFHSKSIHFDSNNLGVSGLESSCGVESSCSEMSGLESSWGLEMSGSGRRDRSMERSGLGREDGEEVSFFFFFFLFLFSSFSLLIFFSYFLLKRKLKLTKKISKFWNN